MFSLGGQQVKQRVSIDLSLNQWVVLGAMKVAEGQKHHSNSEEGKVSKLKPCSPRQTSGLVWELNTDLSFSDALSTLHTVSYFIFFPIFQFSMKNFKLACEVTKQWTFICLSHREKKCQCFLNLQGLCRCLGLCLNLLLHDRNLVRSHNIQQ